MKNVLKLTVLLVSLALWVGLSSGCRGNHPDYQNAAENFVRTYYIEINPKGALQLTRGPAAEKMKQELELLAGLASPKAEERPEMVYKVYSCRSESSDSAHCQYSLDIQTERLLQRKGQMTLRHEDGQWWVTQFIEEHYEK